MKNTLLKLSQISLFAVLCSTTHAATITWDDGAGDDNWSSGANWDAPEVAPVNGDSVVLTATAQSRLDYAWTIESGQSLTSTSSGFGDELALADGTGALTLATGGTMDIGFMRPRFGGGDFTIESGASLATDNYGLASNTANITFIANTTGVTLWDNSVGQYQSGGDNLTVNLAGYDFSNGNTLTLVNYGTFTTGGAQDFATVSVVGGIFQSIDYGDGTNDSITITVSAITPEPSTLALFMIGLVVLRANRRRLIK